MNVLCVVAHADDLELMAGGTVSRWLTQGHTVHVLTLTNGEWHAPDGTLMRSRNEARQEEHDAANYLGVSMENLGCPAMNLNYQDQLVVEVLRRVERYQIDTLLCPWENDLHHDHEVAARIAISASRRIPRVLMGQINYHLRDFFVPNVFVDISEHWDKKMAALRCYQSQWKRAGEDWLEFLDVTTRYYGKLVGVERAEGFVSRKLLLDT